MQSIEFGKRNTVLAIVVLTLIAALLRFLRLDFQGLWYDELHSIIPTDPNASFASIVEYCKTDQPPAFFLYLHYFFKIFGYSEVTGKIATAIIGVAAVPAMYWLGKECKNNSVGFVAALITTFNYFAIYYSQELRFYSFAFLFSILSFTLFIRAFRHHKLLDFACYILATSVLLYTHYYGMIIFATQVLIFIALWILTKPSRPFIVKALASGVIVAISFVPWLPVILSDLDIGEFWIQKPKPLFLAEYFYGYLGKDFVLAAMFIGLIIFLFWHFKAESKSNESKSILIILILWLVLSYAIPFIRSLTSTPMLHIRYTIVTLPAWIILIAWGFTLITRQRLQIALAGVIVLSSVVNLLFLRKHYSKIDKQQFREAAAIVKEKRMENQPVVTTFPWHYGFYFKDTNIVLLSTSDSIPSDSFWILPVQTFSAKEINDELLKFPGFEVSERYTFNKAEAVLMVRSK